MARLKLEALLPGLVADFRAILLETQEYYAPSEINPPDAWRLLSKVSRDRAYDDSHPFFVANKWRRILPYDGRKYCFYYIAGANDNHVASLLKAVVSRLCEEHETTNISSKRLQSEPPSVAGRPNAPDRPALRRATAGRKSSFSREVFYHVAIQGIFCLPGSA